MANFCRSRIFFHSTAVAIMMYGYHGLTKQPLHEFISSQYGGRLQYLIIQGLFIACATTLTSLIIELFPWTSASLKHLKRILLFISMPLLIVISSIYWPLFFLATGLVLQSETGELSSSPSVLQFRRIPLRLDLALHAVPVITLLTDFLLFDKKFSRTEMHYGAPASSILYTIFYAWWVERCASFNDGNFPYPFLTENSIEVRLAIYVGAGMLSLSSLFLTNRLHA